MVNREIAIYRFRLATTLLAVYSSSQNTCRDRIESEHLGTPVFDATSIELVTTYSGPNADEDVLPQPVSVDSARSDTSANAPNWRWVIVCRQGIRWKASNRVCAEGDVRIRSLEDSQLEAGGTASCCYRTHLERSKGHRCCLRARPSGGRRVRRTCHEAQRCASHRRVRMTGQMWRSA